MIVREEKSGDKNASPVHTYNSGHPYKVARGRAFERGQVERHRPRPHAIIHGQPTAQEFLSAVRRELKIRMYSRNSIRSYLSALRSFLRWFGAAPNLVGSEDVRNFLEVLVDGGAGSAHLAVNLSAIRTAFDKFCCRDVTLGLATPRRKKSQPVVLSPDEVTRVLGAAPRLTIKLAIGIMYAAGLRNSELCRLRVRDLDFERRTIRVDQGKGRSDRLVMLPDSFKPTLRKWCEARPGDAWLFPAIATVRKNRHLSPRTLQRWVTCAAELAGIKKHVTPHSFRHAFATHLLENGTDIRFIQKLLGHQRLETTTIYTRVARLSADNIVSPLDRLSRQATQGHPSNSVSRNCDANGQTHVTGETGETSLSQSVSGDTPLAVPPVGRMAIRLSLAEDRKSAEVMLEISGAIEATPIDLPGIRVSQTDHQWIQLELPLLEQWEPELARLPVSQRERIQTPEFFERLRSLICRRYQSALDRDRLS